MPRRSRSPGQRAGLHRADIILAARELSRLHGPKGLTMRRLARELRVTPNTLYSYFPSKDALLAALVDWLLSQVDMPNLVDADWMQGIHRIMEGSRRMLLDHHELIPAFLAEPMNGEHAVRLGEATLALLAKAGVTGKYAVDALRILLIFTFGFVAMEAPRRKRPARRFTGSSADLPMTRAYDGLLGRQPDDATFQQGLAWILFGIGGATGKTRSAAYTLR